MSIYPYQEIKHEHIMYSPPVKQGQVYYSQISYKENPLVIKTPLCICKNGGEDILKKSTHMIDTEGVTDKYGLYDFIVKLDDRNIKETCAQSKHWFQKEIPLELIDDMYKRTSKSLKNKQTPTIQWKLPFQSSSPLCKIFNQHKEDISLSDIHKDTNVELIIHIKGLKFLKQHYYCDCYVSQLKAHVNTQIPSWIPDTCVFSDEEDDVIDGEILETLSRKQISESQESEKKNIQQQIRELQEKLEGLDKTQPTI